MCSIVTAYPCVYFLINGEYSRFGLAFLNTYWLVTLTVAMLALNRSDIQTHKRFMMRNLSGFLAFVTYRVGI